MKRFGLSTLMLAMALLPAMVYAQLNGTSIKADVPFDFTAGATTIPAGQCLVRVEAGNGALWVANQDAQAGVFVVGQRTESLDPSDRTVLTFHKYGVRYFLTSIARSGSSAGYKIPESKVEKELRAGNMKPQQIQLAAK